jgi:hypothetical protein
LLYLIPFASFLAEKVACLVFQNAASVAALLLTTDVVVTKKPKKHGGQYPRGLMTVLILAGSQPRSESCIWQKIIIDTRHVIK